VADSFYWHDYETFGTDPSRDRPVQFAGLRTDAQLNVIGDPLVIFARPSPDLLPQPQACLVTGITPQQALAEGLPEAEFIARIHEQLAQAGTCSVGYNSIRFDDEVTRYTLYRNFYDPYAREWQNGNSRWDIIDMLRLTRALRPEGINWADREDGGASFRLEDLTRANSIEHAAAHDALADVEATLAMARLVRDQQPRLFEYVLSHRDKRSVLAQLDMKAMKPVLHVSGMFGAARQFIALVVPITRHPTNSNEIICYDLGVDVEPMLQLDAEQLRERLFRPTAQLGEGEIRPGLKSIHINRAPVVVTPKLLDEATARRLQIDVPLCRERRRVLQAIPDLAQRIQSVFSGRTHKPVTDPERMLYSGSFFNDADKQVMTRVRAATPEQLRDESFVFEDTRLPELLFRYRARNFPASLTDSERAQWEEFRFAYLTDPEAGASICLDDYQQQITALLASPQSGPRELDVLQRLLDYGDQILA
jgi:exodeoxyribonuclease-1